MDEQWSPEPIRQLLNRSLEQIVQSTLARLHAARLLALNRHKDRTATLPLFAWPGGHVIWEVLAHHHSIFHWIGAMLLAAIIFNCIVSWQDVMDNDTNDEDIAILTDDLPLQYFLE